MTLWGGRPSDVTWQYTTDTHDRRLLQVDIEGSIAHARMLGEAGIVAADEALLLVDGLDSIAAEAMRGDFEFLDSDEDVHTAVERRLTEVVGEVGGKLHTGRSRNDQIALDLRLYLTRAGTPRRRQLQSLATALIEMAEAHVATIVPSYTHLQQAQPTSLGHLLLAHAWMAMRSDQRFEGALQRIDWSPLGAGASSGSSLPIDRDSVARQLGMSGVIPNSLDAVGTRDFVAEYVFASAQAMVDLSRLATEVVLWSTTEFGWVTLSSEVSTGSSALPQKRNPDVAELIRGRTASVVGDVSSILTLQKGLPLSYNRDFQEDKRIVFHADDVLESSLRAMLELLSGLEFHVPPPDSNTVALDLAEVLVGRGVPFRQAHQAIGRLIEGLRLQGRTLADATRPELEEAHPSLNVSDIGKNPAEVSLKRRVTSGSGSTDSVTQQVVTLRELLEGRNLD